MHRQPTPSSVAHAEAQLGEMSEKNIDAYDQAMERAVEADEGDNLAECEKALTEARGILDAQTDRLILPDRCPSARALSPALKAYLGSIRGGPRRC
jgi:hypothetical protein